MPDYSDSEVQDGTSPPGMRLPPVVRRRPSGWVLVAAAIAGLSLAAALGFWVLAAVSPRDQLFISVIGAMWAVNALFFWWQWRQARQRRS